jgi:hypothetical protein
MLVASPGKRSTIIQQYSYVSSPIQRLIQGSSSVPQLLQALNMRE